MKNECLIYFLIYKISLNIIMEQLGKNFNYNNLEEKNYIDCKYIAEKLKVNSFLTFLNLIYNNFTNKGIKYIVERLKFNFSLISLNLIYINITNK